MSPRSMPRRYPRPNITYLSVFVASLLLSLIAYLQRDIINGDGILYINVAKSFLSGGVTDAFSTFNWPVYGILIGLTHQATQIGLESSAHLLNAILISFGCVAFVACYAEINRNGARPWLAGVLILALPIVNQYRDFIIRDFGYWMFLLFAVYFFLRFARNKDIVSAIFWQLNLVAAIAFRIEGAIFALASLVYCLTAVTGTSKKIQCILKCNFVFAAAAILSAAIYFSHGSAQPGANVATLHQWLSYLSPSAVIEGILREADILRQQLQHLSSRGDAALVLMTGLIALIAYKLAVNAVLPFCVISVYGYRKNWLPANHASRIIWAFLILALLAILALVASRFFLSSRYTVAATLLLSLITFAYVDTGLRRLAENGHKNWLAAAWGAILLMFLDGLISSGASKQIIRTGAEHALRAAEQNTTWLCNEPRLVFYTHNKCQLIERDTLLQLLRESEQDEPRTLLIWTPRKDTELKTAIEGNKLLHLIDAKGNSKGDKLSIYGSGSLP